MSAGGKEYPASWSCPSHTSGSSIKGTRENLLSEPRHLHPQVISQKLHGPWLHGHAFQRPCHRRLVHSQFVGDFRIAEPFFQAFFFEDFNFIHRSSFTRSTGFNILRPPFSFLALPVSFPAAPVVRSCGGMLHRGPLARL